MPTFRGRRPSSSLHPSKNSGDYENDRESPSHQSGSLHQLHSTSSYELGPHPADPHSTVLPISTSLSSPPIFHNFNVVSSENGYEATNESVKRNKNWHGHKFGPGTCTERVLGQELWVYGGTGRFVILTLQVKLTQHFGSTFTFWRFLIKVPLAQHEMVIKYSVNNGQQIEFWVPGRMQNMRWAAHSVRIRVCNSFCFPLTAHSVQRILCRCESR